MGVDKKEIGKMTTWIREEHEAIDWLRGILRRYFWMDIKIVKDEDQDNRS